MSLCLMLVPFIFFSDHQPSITGSNDSTSLDSRSYIAQFQHRDHDVDSHASLIPAPRSTTVSITSSLDNMHTKSASNTNICAGLPEVSCQDDETLNVISSDDVISPTSSLQTERKGTYCSNQFSETPDNSFILETTVIEDIKEEE